MQIVFTDGLGNEMFQFALFLAMKFHGRNPSINTGIISRNIVHNGFELCDDFEIDRNSLNIVDGGRFGGGLTIFAVRYLKGLCCALEDSNTFPTNIFKTKKPIVYGYWQDERFFSDIKNEVRKAFTFRDIDERNRSLGSVMKETNSVSLHIRRGDYLKYPQLQICTPSYYERAIYFIRENVQNPVFYVFSDDLDWSDNFMKDKDVEYHLVEHNRGKDSYKDMFLMSCCKHNVIANSSFSWWGAWLGRQEGKIVIAPNEWIKGKTKDPCPSNWVRMNILPPPYGRLSIVQILNREYGELKTGRKPKLLFAIRAYFCSDTFRLTVLMRRMLCSDKWWRVNRLRHEMMRHYSVEISHSARIGRNLRFHHLSGIVIGDNVVVGENCHIYQGVLLGQSNGLYPTIGNNVTLYPYCCVLGDVQIGNGSIIAAHAVVTHDVPPHCMVAGNPARIIKRAEQGKELIPSF